MKKPVSRFTAEMLAGVPSERDVVSFSIEASLPQQALLIKSRLRNGDHDVTILFSSIAHHVVSAMSVIDRQAKYTSNIKIITERIPTAEREMFSPRPIIQDGDREGIIEGYSTTPTATEVHGYNDCVYLAHLIDPKAVIYKILRLRIPTAILLAKEMGGYFDRKDLTFVGDIPPDSTRH